MKIIMYISLLTSLSGLATGAQADKGVPKPHPADIRLQTCQDKAVSTVDIRECIASASADWDKALNTAYQQLLKDQPADVVAALRASQRAWLAYRDSYRDAVVALYGQNQGTIWPVVMDDAMLQFVRDKALSLQQLNDAQKMD